MQEWCRQNGAEVLAVQPPGRGARRGEPFATSARQLATGVLGVVGSRLAGPTPYVVVSHSMGSWVAFEMLRTARAEGEARQGTRPQQAGIWLI